MASLILCSDCQRHCFKDEQCCPFCGGALSAPRRLPVAPAGLKRAALFALSASLTAGVACAGSDEASDSDDVAQHKGKPAPTSTNNTPAPHPDEDDSVQPLYGAPAPLMDAGAPEEEPVLTPDPFEGVPIYGAVPAPLDADR